MRYLVDASFPVLSRAGSQVCVLAITIVATRTLGVADFGAYAIASSIVIVSRTLFVVGAYEYLLKTPDRPALKGSCLVVNVLAALATMLASAGFALLAPALFGASVIGSLTLLLTPSLLLGALTAWFEALLLRRRRVRAYYAASLAADVLAAAATMLGFRLGYGVFALVAQTYVRLAVLALCYARHAADARGCARARRADIAAIVRWSWPRYASALLAYWSVYGADLLLGALLGPAASGLYRAGNRIVAAIADLFWQPLQTITQTRLSARTARGEPPGREWLTLFAAAAAFGWAALAGLAVFAPAVVPALLGARWAPAAPIVVLLCAVRGATLINAATGAYLACANRQRFMLLVQSTVAVLIVAVSAALAWLGPLAVAGGVGAVMCGGALVLALRSARLAGIGGRALLGAVGVALVPALALIAGAAVARQLGRPSSLASLPFAGQLLLALAGALAGLFAIRRRLPRPTRAARASGADA